MINFDVQMTIYLAWAVRIALLVFYIPLGILSSMIQSAHRLDLWASAIVMQSAVHLQDCRSERTLEDRRFLSQRKTWRGESPTASRFRLELREL